MCYFKLILHSMETPSQTSPFSSLVSKLWKPELLLASLTIVTLHRIWVAKRTNNFINWPFLGMLPSYVLVQKRGFHEAITEVLNRHNRTFILRSPWFFNFEFVFTSDPRNLEHIFKTNFYDFHKGHFVYTIMHDFLGDSLNSMDGEPWRWLRKLINMKIVFADFNNAATESWVKLIQSRLLPISDSFARNSEVFDLEAVFSRLLFDQSVITVFGIDPRSLDHGLPHVKFFRSFKKITQVSALRYYIPVFAWKLMKYLNVGPEKQMTKAVKELNEIVYKIIDQRKTELSDKNPRYDFLSLLMEMKDENGKCYPDKFLRDNSINVQFAGADTITTALSWFFYVLCQHPKAEKAVYEEICGIVGKDDTRAVYRAEGVKKMHYLHAALTESMRLFPPVPFNQSEVHKAGELPDGTKLRKGVRVVVSAYAMARNESVWGEDCREFRPERWFKDGKFVPETQYKWPVFNAGLRNCLGKDLAYRQIKVVIASIIYRYRVKLVENHPVQPKLSIMLLMKYGLKVSFTRRSDDEDNV